MISKYPYTDIHELNLNWILEQMQTLDNTVKGYIAYNNLVFADPIEWSPLTFYKKNTIVLASNGDTYVSKEDVPAGFPLDGDKWQKIGNYNAQLEDISEEVEALNNTVSDVRSDMDDVLEDTYTLTGENYLLVSDSYGGTPTVQSSWQSYFRSFLGLDGDHCYAVYKDGYGFKPRDYNAPFKDLITPGLVSGGVPEDFDCNKITKIVVGGGFNDRLTPANDLQDAIYSFIQYAKNKYPNAKVYIAPVGNSFNHEFKQELGLMGYVQSYKNAAIFGGICLNNTEYIMDNFSYFREESSTRTLALGHQYVHPNDAGSRAIANGIINALSCSFSPNYGYVSMPLTNVSGVTKSLGIAQYMKGNNVYINWSAGELTLNPGVNLNGVLNEPTEIDLGLVNGGYFNSTDIPTEFVVRAYAGGSAGNFIAGAVLRFKNGHLYLAINSNGESIKNCTKVWFRSGSGVIMQ